jgi:murein DD-endopeptidase MepM/ murein hydrolase activator NlpD
VQYRPEMLRESDRYRGRRRAPSPPRSRYAAVVTTAFVGAGVVALAAGAGIQDAKVDAITADASSVADSEAARQQAIDRASRGDRALATSISSTAPDAWLLPLHNYSLTSKFGQRWGRLHAGVDLALPEGTPIMAMHKGTVVLAGWHGGYGNAVIIDHGNGLQTLYGHNSALMVKVGQEVNAGDVISKLGNTGFSTGPHLHLEIHVNGKQVDPIAFFQSKGVDLKMEIETIYGGSAS